MALQPEGASTESNAARIEYDPYSSRREIIRRDIARRLRRVCCEYSDDEFLGLVELMTDNQLRGEHRMNRLPD